MEGTPARCKGRPRGEEEVSITDRHGTFDLVNDEVHPAARCLPCLLIVRAQEGEWWRRL
jgi:hypothetical protein